MNWGRTKICLEMFGLWRSLALSKNGATKMATWRRTMLRSHGILGRSIFKRKKYDGHDSPKLPWPCTGSSHATPALEGQRSAFQRNAAHSRGFQAAGLQETNLKRSKRDQIWQMVCITFGNLEMICNPVIFDCYTWKNGHVDGVMAFTFGPLHFRSRK